MTYPLPLPVNTLISRKSTYSRVTDLYDDKVHRSKLELALELLSNSGSFLPYNHFSTEHDVGAKITAFSDF